MPRWIDLHNPNESVREDYAPPAHARKTVKRKSPAGGLLESLVVLLYGREAVLRAPTHVAVDSQHRLVITDPDASAIDVLDGQHSLRIVGGPGRRLQHPNGIALDADGNIYVADGKLGVVLVYDPGGRFLRVLGSFRGESMFQDPTGIAIDPKAGRLYVLDSPADELTVLDLQGNVIKRAGGYRKIGGVTFDNPTEIAVRDNLLVVLDDVGSRIQVFDLQCRLIRGFRIRNVTGRPAVAEIGLALDSAGNIYVSNLGHPLVRLYNQSGRLIGSFGRLGQREKELNGPSGLWIDSTDRIYVADTYNSRIQIFQRAATAAPGKTMPPSQTQSGFSASTR